MIAHGKHTKLKYPQLYTQAKNYHLLERWGWIRRWRHVVSTQGGNMKNWMNIPILIG